MEVVIELHARAKAGHEFLGMVATKLRGELTAVANKRKYLRSQAISGKSRYNGEPLKERLLKKNWPELLDAHYECARPGPTRCLQDALHVITTGKVLITCPRVKKRKRDEQQEEDVEEPRTLSELEVQLIKEWYDNKDKELVGTMG